MNNRRIFRLTLVLTGTAIVVYALLRTTTGTYQDFFYSTVFRLASIQLMISAAAAAAIGCFLLSFLWPSKPISLSPTLLYPFLAAAVFCASCYIWFWFGELTIAEAQAVFRLMILSWIFSTLSFSWSLLIGLYLSYRKARKFVAEEPDVY